jgi:hypothetical protein
MQGVNDADIDSRSGCHRSASSTARSPARSRRQKLAAAIQIQAVIARTVEEVERWINRRARGRRRKETARRKRWR